MDKLAIQNLKELNNKKTLIYIRIPVHQNSALINRTCFTRHKRHTQDVNVFLMQLFNHLFIYLFVCFILFIYLFILFIFFDSSMVVVPKPMLVAGFGCNNEV